VITLLAHSWVGPRRSFARPASPIVVLAIWLLGKEDAPSRFDGRVTLGRKLYCGNLGYDVSALDLEKLFGQFGQVRDAQVVSDRDTGQSKGFAFIEMNSDSEATAAINGLNGTMQNGRPLTVNEAKPRESRGGGGGGGGGGRTFGGNRGGRY
jgi:RNA recognition motif-containing protein